MKLRRVLVVAVAFIAFGILTVWQHVEMFRLGRRIEDLKRASGKMEQEYSKLVIEVRSRKTPDYLLKKAKELGLDVGNYEKPGCMSETVVPADRNRRSE